MTLPTHPRAVITGGAGGLGRALALEIAKRGGKVVVADLNLEGAQQVAREVIALGAEAEATRCDVTKLEDVERLASLADEKFGGADLIVNNAGVAVAGPVGEIPMKDWEWIFGINLWGVIYGCHVFVPRFKKQGSGHVLNVASAAGLLCAPDMSPYNVTKAGVVALSETLAGELAFTGVGVTVLCPTFFKTGIVDNARMQAGSEATRSLAQSWSDRSKLQADGVAKYALSCCDRDTLYAVPMSDGKWAWRFKRLAPQSYYRAGAKVFRRLRERAARGG